MKSMRTDTVKAHLDMASRVGTQHQFDLLKLAGIHDPIRDQDAAFDIFCKTVVCMSGADRTRVLCGIFGEDDASMVLEVIKSSLSRPPELQLAAAGWWVLRSVDFDSKFIPRSRFDTQEAAVAEMLELRKIYSLNGMPDEKLVVAFIPERV